MSISNPIARTFTTLRHTVSERNRPLRNFAIFAVAISYSTLSLTAQNTPGGMVSGTFVNNTTQGGGYHWQFFNQSQTLGTDTWSKSSASAQVYGNAQEFGVLKSLAMASRIDNGFSEVVIAVGFQDNITISDPSRNGQVGTYVGSMRVDMEQDGYGWQLGATYYNIFGFSIGSSIANARSAFSGGSTYGSIYHDWYGGAPLHDVHTNLQFSIPFTFGTPFGIGAYMTSTAKTGYGDGAAVLIRHDATNTAAWGGTVAVYDSTNTALASGSYTLSSASGTNYALAIPEPSTCAAVLGAMGLFVLRRRRV